MFTWKFAPICGLEIDLEKDVELTLNLFFSELTKLIMEVSYMLRNQGLFSSKSALICGLEAGSEKQVVFAFTFSSSAVVHHENILVSLTKQFLPLLHQRTALNATFEVFQLLFC